MPDLLKHEDSHDPTKGYINSTKCVKCNEECKNSKDSTYILLNTVNRAICKTCHDELRLLPRGTLQVGNIVKCSPRFDKGKTLKIVEIYRASGMFQWHWMAFACDLNESTREISAYVLQELELI